MQLDVDKELRTLADAGGQGWIAPEDQPNFNELAVLGLVTTDGLPDAEGDVFYKLSAMGEKWAAANGTPPAKPTAAQPSPLPGVATSAVAADFDTEDAVWNKPHRSRREHRPDPAMLAVREAIGFDAMPVGASKHIAVTDAVPMPWRNYERLVSAENKRHATPRVDANGQPVMVARKSRKMDEVRMRPVFDYSKKFIIYRAKKDDPRGPGARVKRLSPSE